jgi:hypothetical protein
VLDGERLAGIATLEALLAAQPDAALATFATCACLGTTSAPSRGEGNVDACVAAKAGEPVAEVGAEQSVQRRFGGLDDRDVRAACSRGGRDLLADEAGSDDGQSRARGEGC